MQNNIFRSARDRTIQSEIKNGFFDENTTEGKFQRMCCHKEKRRNCMTGSNQKNISEYYADSLLRRISVSGSLKSIFIMATIVVMVACVQPVSATFQHQNMKYNTNIIKTKYGPLRGIIVRSNPTVEAFLGVPYASPPVGSLRYMPPVTPSTWRTPRLADRFSAVCPQVAPVPPSGPEALLEVPRGRLAQLRLLLPLLSNQSEDCLYLNLFVPRPLYTSSGFAGDAVAPEPTVDGISSTYSDGSSAGGHSNLNKKNNDKPLATIVYIHGESYEWNSGNPYDGSVLAAHGNVIVVTINFRLGVLGFLKTGGKGSAQGNFGLMDLVAGLHWLRENLPAFGGDPDRVTVMGHGTGAALANILIVSPVASDLVHRAILLSGSALSPWAIQKDPLFVKRRVAEATGCHGDLLEDDLAPCLRTKPVSELLAVKVDSPRFLPGFAPFIDGTVISHSSGGASGPLTLPVGSAIASTNGIELADFPTRELLFGLTTTESYLDLSAQDLEFGFNETRRDRILRTYVRNVYHFHLNEIYAALKNEYTDWERPGRNPMGSRDAALELLSDGHTAAPLVRLGYLHSLRGGRSYFIHFRHQSGERDYPQRGGSVRGEDVPFCLGLPISPLFPHNYTKQDIKISRIMIRYLANFAETGNPNETPPASVHISHIVHSKSGLVSSSLTVVAPSSASSFSSATSEGDGIASGMSSASQSSPAVEMFPSSSSRVSSSTSYESAASASSFLPSSKPAADSGSSIVKHVNDQYLSQISFKSSSLGSSPAKISPLSSSSSSSLLSSVALLPSTSLSSSSSTMMASLTSSAGDSNVLLMMGPSYVRTMNSKRHAISSSVDRRKRKSTNTKRPLRNRSGLTGGDDGSKSFHRKKYPSKSKDGSLEDIRSIAADQGILVDGKGNRISRGHVRNGIKPTDDYEDDEDESADSEEEDEDHNPDGDKRSDDHHDDEETDTDSNNHHRLDENEDEDEVEKFDRFGGVSITRLPFWDTYDAINQLYLELGSKVEIRNHYRGHKLSMWLSLIPQLHAPLDLSELPMRHHHFLEDSAQYYDGIIRPQILQRPNNPKQQQPFGPQISQQVTTVTTPKADMNAANNNGAPATTTECPPNTTIVPTIAATRPQNHQQNGSGSGTLLSGNKHDQQQNNLLRRLATSQYQSYTTALTVTIAVGCFLLLLNVLIFAGIYYQREKRANDAKKKEELREAETRCSTSTSLEKLAAASGICASGKGGGGGIGSRKSSLQSLTGFNSSGSFGEYSCYDEKLQCKEKHALADICSVELPLKEFKCSSITSPTPSNTGSLRRSTTNIVAASTNTNPANGSSGGGLLMYPPSYHPHSHPHQQQPQNPHGKIMHHFILEEHEGCSNNGIVTYQQFQKTGCQMQPQQQQPTSANVGTSTDQQCNQSTQSDQPTVQDVGTSVEDKAVDCDDLISPGIPKPPPPPKSSVPGYHHQGGILRQPGPPTTPGSSKKRVQIQEISV